LLLLLNHILLLLTPMFVHPARFLVILCLPVVLRGATIAIHVRGGREAGARRRPSEARDGEGAVAQEAAEPLRGEGRAGPLPPALGGGAAVAPADVEVAAVHREGHHPHAGRRRGE